jgi:hypothetical protein
MLCVHVAGTLITYWQMLIKVLVCPHINGSIPNLRQVLHDIDPKKKFCVGRSTLTARLC